MSAQGDNAAIIHALCYKVAGRMKAAGVSVSMEDLLQEALIAEEKARRSFDDSRNATFSTYCSRAVMNRLNKIADQEIHRVQFECQSSEWVEIESDQGPDLTLERQQRVNQLVTNLSPLAGAIVLWVSKPPGFVQEEIHRRIKVLNEQKRTDSRYISSLAVIRDLLTQYGYTKSQIDRGLREIRECANGI